MTSKKEKNSISQASSQTGEAFVEFCEVIDALRRPDGCPWDIKQTHKSIAGDMAEEAAEAIDAIYADDIEHLREELGDVLQQVIFHTSIASQNGEFSIDDVIADIKAKMIRRHPHVFGAQKALIEAGFSEEEIKYATTPGAVLDMWQHIKEKERELKEQARIKRLKQKGKDTKAPEGLLDGIPRSLPALRQADKISKKTVNVGFEWQTTNDVWRKYEEERAEFKEACEIGKSEDEIAEEFGDMLFTLVNVARKEHINAEDALRASCEKFRKRWELMEKMAYEEQGLKIEEVVEHDKEGLEKLWNCAKKKLSEEKQVNKA